MNRGRGVGAGVRGCVVKVRVINKIGRGLHLSKTNHWMKDGGWGEGGSLSRNCLKTCNQAEISSFLRIVETRETGCKMTN